MGVNLLEKLSNIRAKNALPSNTEVLEGFKALLNQPNEGERILRNLFKSEGGEEQLDFDALEVNRIYHIEDIKKLCIDYRLRFLDSKHFNGTFPAEAIDAIKDFEAKQGKEIKGFKMIAPAGMFKLAEKDKDPILMVPMGNGYYYQLAQWERPTFLAQDLGLPVPQFRDDHEDRIYFCCTHGIIVPGECDARSKRYRYHRAHSRDFLLLDGLRYERYDGAVRLQPHEEFQFKFVEEPFPRLSGSDFIEKILGPLVGPFSV